MIIIANNSVLFAKLSEEKYQNLENKDPGTFYLTDQNLYLGDILLSSNVATSESLGIVKPDNNSIQIDDAGQLHVCWGDILESALPKIVSWKDGTDEEICAMVRAADAGLIDLQESGWNIGDERNITLSAMDAEYVSESHVEQEVTLVLMSTRQFNLVNPIKNSKGKTENRCNFTVGLKDCLGVGDTMERGKVDYGSSGSWDTSKRREWCNDTFKKSFPSSIIPIFKQFKVPTAGKNGTMIYTEDYFSLFAEGEILKYMMGDQTLNQSQLCAPIQEYEIVNPTPYFTSYESIIKYASNTSNDPSPWLLRSPCNGFYGPCYVTSSGSIYLDFNNNANYGISPIGCI